MTETLFGVPTWYLPTLSLSLVATALGVVVTWQAYRGFKRHDERPLLFLAVGLAFLTVSPLVLDLTVTVYVARNFGAEATARIIPLVDYVTRIIGLAFVLYSLYGRRRSPSAN